MKDIFQWTDEVRKVAIRYCNGNTCDFQDIRDELWLSLVKLKGDEHKHSFIREYLKCRAIDYVKSRKHCYSYAGKWQKVSYENILPAHEDLGFPIDTFTEIKITDKLCVDELLSHLDDNIREALQMWSMGYKQREIAQVQCITRSAVSRRIKKGLSALRVLAGDRH